MKKVFLIHGFEGSPNGGWRPWLMGKLEKRDVYACALSMPAPEAPQCAAWIEEIWHAVAQSQNRDEISLVGHSLGGPAVLRYLETAPKAIAGAILVSSPSERNDNPKIDSFMLPPFDLAALKSKAGKWVVIHGDDDPFVPTSNAKALASGLGAELIWVPGGKHLNGSAGFTELPQVLEALGRMMV